MGNQLDKIVADIENQQLTGLSAAYDFSAIKIGSLLVRGVPPKLVSLLTDARKLDVHGTGLVAVPQEIGQLRGLVVLSLEDNKIETLPREISNLSILQTLNAFKCKLTSVPDELCNLTSLTTLVLHKNSLPQLPSAIGNLCLLRLLYVGGNKLAALPDTLWDCAALEELHAQKNSLSALTGMHRAKKLKLLNAKGNNLESLPDMLGRCATLTELNVDGNKLASLPDTIGDTPKLITLYIQNNKLVDLPVSFGRLTGLQTLDMTGNPLKPSLKKLKGFPARTVVNAMATVRSPFAVEPAVSAAPAAEPEVEVTVQPTTRERSSTLSVPRNQRAGYLVLKHCCEALSWVHALLGDETLGFGNPPLQNPSVALYNPGFLIDGAVLCVVLHNVNPELVADMDLGLASAKKLYVPSTGRRVSRQGAAKNVDLFLAGCKTYGMMDEELFQPDDLLLGKDLPKVYTTLALLGAAATDKGFQPPLPSLQNNQSFKAEQIALAVAILKAKEGMTRKPTDADGVPTPAPAPGEPQEQKPIVVVGTVVGPPPAAQPRASQNETAPGGTAPRKPAPKPAATGPKPAAGGTVRGNPENKPEGEEKSWTKGLSNLVDKARSSMSGKAEAKPAAKAEPVTVARPKQPEGKGNAFKNIDDDLFFSDGGSGAPAASSTPSRPTSMGAERGRATSESSTTAEAEPEPEQPSARATATTPEPEPLRAAPRRTTVVSPPAEPEYEQAPDAVPVKPAPAAKSVPAAKAEPAAKPAARPSRHSALPMSREEAPGPAPEPEKPTKTAPKPQRASMGPGSSATLPKGFQPGAMTFNSKPNETPAAPAASTAGSPPKPAAVTAKSPAKAEEEPPAGKPIARANTMGSRAATMKPSPTPKPGTTPATTQDDSALRTQRSSTVGNGPRTSVPPKPAKPAAEGDPAPAAKAALAAAAPASPAASEPVEPDTPVPPRPTAGSRLSIQPPPTKIAAKNGPSTPTGDAKPTTPTSETKPATPPADSPASAATDSPKSDPSRANTTGTFGRSGPPTIKRPPRASTASSATIKNDGTRRTSLMNAAAYVGDSRLVLEKLATAEMNMLRRRTRKEWMEEGWALEPADVTIKQAVGKGTFGSVFVADYLGVEVAVKQVPIDDGDALTQHLNERELSILKRLRHPNVLQFIGTYEDEKNVCVVTEYMPNQHIGSLVKAQGHAVPWRLLLRVMLDAARGLAYLHQNNIVHRNVKAENFLLTDTWRAKVADFGFARVLEMQEKGQARMTICGTNDYMAPEVMFGMPYDKSIDVYSYGLTVLELLTGVQAGTGLLKRMITRGLQLDLAAIKPQIRKDCPEELVRATFACVSTNAVERPTFDMLAQFLESLESALESVVTIDTLDDVILTLVEVPAQTDLFVERESAPDQAETQAMSKGDGSTPAPASEAASAPASGPSAAASSSEASKADDTDFIPRTEDDRWNPARGTVALDILCGQVDDLLNGFFIESADVAEFGARRDRAYSTA